MFTHLEKTLQDRATIERADASTTTGETAIGEPQHDADAAPVAEGVPCLFEPRETALVREETGEREQRPASATFLPDEDVQVGDTVTFDRHDHDIDFEVRGTAPDLNLRTGSSAAYTVELERSD